MNKQTTKRRVARPTYDHIDWTGLHRLRTTLINDETGKPYTQTQIAKRANITQAYYSKIELGGVRSPDKKVIQSLAAAFSTTASDFMAALPNKEPSKPSGATQVASEKRFIPKYKFAGKPKGFDFDDGIVMDSNDLTETIPAIQNVPDAYAVVMPTSDMEPRYREGDTLFVDPELAPYYGDDVVIKLQYAERTILLVRELVNMEATWDEDDELIPTYGVLSAQHIRHLENEMAIKSHSQEEVYDEMDRLELLSENAKWFCLYPEYVDAPKEAILSAEEDNEGHPFAINVDVVVGSIRHRYMRAGSPLKQRYEVNQEGNFGGFTGISDENSIKRSRDEF